MRVIDPGHKYALTRLDGHGEELLTFVKREGQGYPGNVGHHPGTNIQEVVRTLIDRLKYVDKQIPHWRNSAAISHLRECLVHLEFRAAERHGRESTLWESGLSIEDEPTCSRCGHIRCAETCQTKEGTL